MTMTDPFILTQYAKLGIYFLFSVFLSCFLLYITTFFGTKEENSAKASTYECGFDTYGDARVEFDVRFYLTTIIFLIFDLETVFVYPWVIAFDHLHDLGGYAMMEFILELLAGYCYAWYSDAFEWD